MATEHDREVKSFVLQKYSDVAKSRMRAGPGGRLAISDVVATRELPEAMRNDPALWSSCVAGAVPVDDLRTILAEIGYHGVAVDLEAGSREQIRQWLPGSGLEEYVVSARIRAVKPN